jgi:hypothetical protein
MRKIRAWGLKYIIYMEISQGNSLCSYLYLKQAKVLCFTFTFSHFSSTKSENRRVEKILPRGEVWHQWEGEGGGEREYEGEYNVKNVFTCM